MSKTLDVYFQKNGYLNDDLANDKDFFRESTIILDPKDFIPVLTLCLSRKSLSLLTERTLGEGNDNISISKHFIYISWSAERPTPDFSHSILAKNITNGRILLKIAQPTDFYEADGELYFYIPRYIFAMRCPQ